MFQIPITSNAQAILQKLDAMPSAMAANIAKAMDLENQYTIGHAQEKYLSGPRPEKLGVRDNRLRPSLNASKAIVDGSTIGSIIGTNVAYAGVHEYGIDKEVQVKAHTRKNPHAGGSAKKNFDMSTGRISSAKKGGAGAVIQVKAFKRHMKMPKRAFLAPSIADRTPNYGASVSAALLASWQEGTTT